MADPRQPDGPAPLVLRPVALADAAQVRLAQAELAADGFTFLPLPPGAPADPWSPPAWAAVVAGLERGARGQDVPPGWVPATFLLGVVGGTVVGRTSVRHELNDALRAWGGHVGYGVRPAFRRRGHATAMLRTSLDLLAGLGVGRALVTCDDGNVGSAAVITRCGGVLADVVDAPDGVPKRRYWVPTGR